MSAHLFDLDAEHVAVTNDDCYTLRWVFDAMDVEFDLDVCAPIGGPWHVPCTRYYTPLDDGLTQPWEGVVWCNPLYSNFVEWAKRWAEHPTGALMGLVASRQQWRNWVFGAADALYIGQVAFARPDGSTVKFGWTAVFVAFRGLGVAPAQRLALSDSFGGVLYGRPA